MKFKSYSFKELLSNIVDNRGKTCPVGDTGLPLIATNCIKEHSLYPVFEKVRYVSDETYNNWFRGHPQPGDMIFVCKGSPGRVNWVPDPVNFCIAQDMVAIRADTTKVYPKYLFALLRSQTSQQKILNMHVGSLIPHFKKGDFGNLYFELPEDLEYQKKVGDAYFDFCLKIESNTQTNQTLEQMAQAIFKSWFVDFDPVKAKMNGEQPEGMDAATASLFPEKLDSETGIPDGWKLSEIGDEVTVVGGGTPSKKNDDFWVDGDIHWTSPKDLSGVQDKVLLDTASKVTEAGLKKISSGLLPVDTVLLSSRAPVGYLALAKVPMAINQGYIAMKCEKQLPPEFVLQWCVHSMDEIKQRASGSTFAEISKKSFKPISVVVPTSEVLSAYQKLVKPLYDAITSNARQNEQLSSLRDTLLPKLLSGEIELEANER
ncbi:restriction endonuclease subunit S [Vibrio vulnificus]|nr:restriction endonuclease subunit S [Vibrio vulnificus]MCU8172638.1 restriction endonuclease subunit S [Vibrio vulnificus]